MGRLPHQHGLSGGPGDHQTVLGQSRIRRRICGGGVGGGWVGYLISVASLEDLEIVKLYLGSPR